MLIPIGHENMAARRWPVITIGLIVINTIVFLATYNSMHEHAPEMGQARAHIILLAAAHPELKMAPSSQKLVDGFSKQNPTEWHTLQQPNHEVFDAWDAQMRLMDDPERLQSEMDSLTEQYATLASDSITHKYAFVPGDTKPISYLTANFLHGGWLHLIGNMWFLWLAGFVLEDVWGRPLFITFYLVAGAAAMQFHAWTNVGSMVPSLGASGAVAGLMGAFLVRFPKMKIEMAWIFGLISLMRRRVYRFKAAAYWLLPIWLGMEILYGGLMGSSGGVAHWAHVGGFLFGVLAALAIQHSGFEHKVNQAIEEKVGVTTDPTLEQASDLMDHGKLDEAVVLLNNHLSANPNSIDGLNLLRTIHWRRNEMPAYQDVTLKVCALHLKAKDDEGAWHDYEDFVKAGGNNLPSAMWLDLAHALESHENYEHALGEYGKLISAYPTERQALMAQMAAARLCLKRLGRPQDALKFYEAAAASPIPHLDLEQSIAMGIREAKNATTQTRAASV
jgi:membrane associated rhomboid family serine protease